MTSIKRRTGILGGSFDPVHLAHIELATAAFKQGALDEIFFIPAKQAPLRDAPVNASDTDRLKMLRLALSKFPFPHKVELFEMNRDCVSYSIDTVSYLTKAYPDRNFVWIIGADHIGKLKKWRDIDNLCKIISFICAARPDYKIEPSDIPHNAKISYIDFSPMPHSSTAIRNAVKNGDSTDFMLDADVANYIFKHKLYK